MSHYTHFTTEEREKSMVMIGQGKSIRMVAKELQRSPSSVSRELKRNANKDGSYSANTARRKYEKRRKNCHRKLLFSENEALRRYVMEHLSEDWSPEQISGRAAYEDQPFSVSYNTIYRAMNSGILPKKLRKHLRIKKTKNSKKKADDKRGTIADTVSIHDRPAEVDLREELGHWESDTVFGKRKTGCIVTHVERKSGFLIAFKLPDRRNDIVIKETIQHFLLLPAVLKKSFTVDNSKEFRSHKLLSEGTNMDVFFCDPFSPWQRGTNENTNGLLRQYYPKGSSFLPFSEDDLMQAVWKINNRPRKRFGFKTPLEVLLDSLHLCCT